jgi:hypothetical protein
VSGGGQPAKLYSAGRQPRAVICIAVLLEDVELERVLGEKGQDTTHYAKRFSPAASSP